MCDQGSEPRVQCNQDHGSAGAQTQAQSTAVKKSEAQLLLPSPQGPCTECGASHSPAGDVTVVLLVLSLQVKTCILASCKRLAEGTESRADSVSTTEKLKKAHTPIATTLQWLSLAAVGS